MKLAKGTCAAASALALIVLSGAPSQAADTYYRWNDESGTPVNSDRPPPAGIEYDVVSKKSNRTNLEDPVEPQSTGSTTRDQSGGGAAVATTSEPEKNPELCKHAKANLETLNTHARIRVPDGEGNYRYIGEEEKAAERANAEKLISQHCE